MAHVGIHSVLGALLCVRLSSGSAPGDFHLYTPHTLAHTQMQTHSHVHAHTAPTRTHRHTYHPLLHCLVLSQSCCVVGTVHKDAVLDWSFVHFIILNS